MSHSSQAELVDYLNNLGVLKDPQIAAAFQAVDRADFVLRSTIPAAYYDEPLPIGYGQSISQPYTVAFILDLLEVEPGNVVMDVGSGSCWQTALLAHIVGNTGKVHAIELVPELYEFGKKNLNKYPKLSRRVKLYNQNAIPGLPQVAEKAGGFDAITSAAELTEIPTAWREQLKVGGKLVYPLNGDLYKEVKRSENDFERERFPGFVFVPLVT